jgi:LCP family protein required for cell wall assembly
MSTSKIRNQGKTARKRKKILAIIAVILILLIFIILLSIQVIRALGKANLQKVVSESQAPVLETDENLTQDEEDDGIIYHNGKKYRYNADIFTLLFMGIDTRAKQTSSDGLGEGGQADAVFLLVLDGKNNKMQLIAIPRDTMTDIKVYDSYGTYFTTSKEQLALQHAYGDGKALSCENMVNAVSNLLYGLPIHGYFALRMDAIAPLNDALGGVTVTIPSDDKFCRTFAYTPGQSVKLRGNAALDFVQYRDIKSFASINLRMARQKIYLSAFFASAKEAFKSNLSLPLTLYQTVSRYTQTDISLDEIAYLSSKADAMEFHADDMRTLQGEIKQGEVYEEFYPDENALYDLVLETFYEEIP